MVFAWLAVAGNGVNGQAYEAPPEAFSQKFNELCAVCHGEDLLGAAQGVPLAGNELVNGDSIADMSRSIANGSPQNGMPVWSETLSADQIRNLAIYIAERRSNLSYLDFRITSAPLVPDGVICSEEHDFRLETVAEKLDPLPYAIAPLPDGRILLTEKMRGLSILSREGRQSDLITGTPRTYDDTVTNSVGSKFGIGWLMDVAIHPDYENNGWVYLQYGDR